MSELYKHKNYLMPISYSISVPIYEYDISKANINILYNKKILSLEEYNRLKFMSRMDRQISVGSMQKANPQLITILADGIIEFKKRFFEANNIIDREILSIKNDAVFVMHRTMPITKFENIEFVLKNSYSLYMKINNIEMYYRSDQINGCDIIDIKGINDNTLKLHENGMLVLLSDIFEKLDCGDPRAAIQVFNEYYSKYIARALPIEYYRSFDSNSMYTINAFQYMYEVPYATDISVLNISYNLNFLRALYGYLSYIYLSPKK